MIFILFLVSFLEKGTKTTNSGNLRVLRSGVVTPRSGEGPRRGEGFPPHSMAEEGEWPDLGFAAA